MIELKETERTYKRDLMTEFGALFFKTTEPLNYSMMEQTSDTIIHIALQQYPDQGKTEDITLYDELVRLRKFGWQIRYIKYDKDSTMHIYFEKIDWRSVEFYGLVPTKHNNEKDIWWLKPDAKPEELGI